MKIFLTKLVILAVQFVVMFSMRAMALDPDIVTEVEDVASVPEISASLLGVCGMFMLLCRRRRSS